MKRVGIRELKAKTSEVLSWVGKGEDVIITVRGREVARLMPIKEDSDQAAARKLIAEGHVRWGGGQPQGLKPRIRVSGRPVSETLLEDRR